MFTEKHVASLVEQGKLLLVQKLRKIVNSAGNDNDMLIGLPLLLMLLLLLLLLP